MIVLDQGGAIARNPKRNGVGNSRNARGDLIAWITLLFVFASLWYTIFGCIWFDEARSQVVAAKNDVIAHLMKGPVSFLTFLLLIVRWEAIKDSYNQTFRCYSPTASARGICKLQKRIGNFNTIAPHGSAFHAPAAIIFQPLAPAAIFQPLALECVYFEGIELVSQSPSEYRMHRLLLIICTLVTGRCSWVVDCLSAAGESLTLAT